MDNNSNFIKIFFSSTYSLQQAKARLRLLRAYLMRSFYQERNIEQNEMQEIDPWLLSLGQDFYKEFTRDTVYKKLRAIEDALAKTTPLVLYIAFDIPEEEVNNLGLWFRQNSQSNILFDIRHDPNLIAGCSLVWHGVYKDYSVRSRIEMNKQKILGNIKSLTK